MKEYVTLPFLLDAIFLIRKKDFFSLKEKRCGRRFQISQFEETADFLFHVLTILLFRKLGILIEEMVKTKEGKNTLNNYLIWQVSSLSEDYKFFLTRNLRADHQKL